MDIWESAVFFIFAAIGFYELLFALVSFLFLAPHSRSCGIIELRGHMENAEQLIRSEMLRNSRIIYIIDRGADSETLLIAQLLSGDFERLVILSEHVP